MKDWSYSEGCGCVVTFFAASEYRTSRLIPGKECTYHTGPYDADDRDLLIERGRDALADYLYDLAHDESEH